MARSVACHPDAIDRIYLHFEYDAWDNVYWWDDFTDHLRHVLTSRYPSFRECDHWYGRETRGILENNLVAVYVSAYGGIVCIDIVPSEYCDARHLAFAEKFAGKVADTLRYVYQSLVVESLGFFSNGEQVFRRTADDCIGNGWCYV